MDKITSYTKYNHKQHRDFYLFHMFHRNYSTYFIILLSLALFAWAIYNATKLEDPKQIIISWLMAVFTIMLIPMMIIGKINNTVKKESIRRKESTDIIEVTKAKLQRSSDIGEGKVVFGWQQIESVCETKNYIYIYTSANQGIFIVKKDIVEGSVDLFYKLASNNMKKNKKGKIKYKRYFRKAKS